MKSKIVLGLSGGVDSAVAAALLRENYEVTCVWLDVGLGGGEDAARLAEHLGLPFEAVDVHHPLDHYVCMPFAEEYLAGRTPLPCARCNPLVKFPALISAADRIGAAHIATGHYARTATGPAGRALLRRGRPANDQSYMLARLTQDMLHRVVFPLGGYEKWEIRDLAEQLGLFVAHKPDSMEICFIPDGDYAAWLDQRYPTPPPGNFIDREGHVLGCHKGIHHYTLGQSRGLGVSGPHRYYVSHIDPSSNTVTLSDGSDLLTTLVHCSRPNWISVETPAGPMDVHVRLRHSKIETPAVVTSDSSGAVLVHTKTPVRAPTPGQLAVFYQGETVLGSAWIEG
jgi:tRNA-specific 2-thiouridylase